MNSFVHFEVELQPVRGPLRVLKVRGHVTWKLQSLEGPVKPGDALHPGTFVYLESGSVVTCDDGTGEPRTFSAGKSSRAISLVSHTEAAQLADHEKMLAHVEMGFQKLVQLATVDSKAATAAMDLMVSRRSTRSLLREFDPGALALLEQDQRIRLRAIPIRTMDFMALLVASDEWTPAKALAIIERTRRTLSLVLVETEQFEELLRKVDKR